MKPGRATVAIAALAAVAGLWWFFPQRLMLEKAATALATPVGVVWCLLLLMSVLALATRQRRLAGLAVVAWLILSLAGNLCLARLAMGTLERPYLELNPLAEPPMSTIVVLGGGASSNYRGAAQLDLAGDRVALAARLFRAGLTERIICTGSYIEAMDLGGGRTQGELARELLIGLGVPAERIETVAGRNTSEEMQALADHLNGQQRVGLVTSASHLPRALRLAAQAKLEMIPLPCNYATPSQLRLLPIHFIPTGHALELSARTVKEYLAALVGR